MLVVTPSEFENCLLSLRIAVTIICAPGHWNFLYLLTVFVVLVLSTPTDNRRPTKSKTRKSDGYVKFAWHDAARYVKFAWRAAAKGFWDLYPYDPPCPVASTLLRESPEPWYGGRASLRSFKF